MRKPVYSIYDEVSCEFGSPFLSHSDAVAYRDFSSQIENARKSNEGLLSTDFADFNLVRIGYFDTVSGEFLTDYFAPQLIDHVPEWHETIAIGSDFVGE